MGASDTRVREEGLLHPLYSRTVFAWGLALLPPGLRPNLITVAGQCCAVLGALTAYFATRGSRPLYLASAASFIGFMLADNLDGMHARHTGQVSRVGELLDHGMDGIASISILLTIGFVTRLDGVLLFGLAYLGTLAFVAAYWEQYRTGLLVCPKFGQLEGITLLATIEVLLFALRDPPWVRVVPWSPDVGAVLLVAVTLGYVGSVATSMLRVARTGGGCRDLVGVALAQVLLVGYIELGAAAWIASATLGLVGADVVVRSIRWRKQGRLAPLMTRWHAAIAAPLTVGLVWRSAAHASIWATIAAGIAVVLYATALRAGIRELAGARTVPTPSPDPRAGFTEARRR